VSAYSELLGAPGVARIIVAQLVARLPSGMLSLALLVHIERVHHTYGAAGLVLAGASIGQAVAGPLTSRLMGRVGMRPVLIATALVCAACILLVALVVMPMGITIAVAALGGLATPPVQPAVRTIYPKIVSSRLLTSLYSLDASAQEIIWIAGPVVITFIAIQVSTTFGLLFCAGMLLVGSAWFIASPELGRVRIPPSTRRLGGVMLRPTVLMATVVSFLLIGACAAVEAGVVSDFGGHGPGAGIVLALWSLCSLVGGVSMGSRPIGPWSLGLRMLAVFVGIGLAGVWVSNPWWLAALLALSGLGIAPAIAVLFAGVSASVRFSDTAEAYGWVGTGQLIGAALGSATAGFMIDRLGPSGAFWAAGVLALLGAVVPLLGARWQPDLRNRDAGPLPDTAPVPSPRS
jgi:MFS family permease